MTHTTEALSVIKEKIKRSTCIFGHITNLSLNPRFSSSRKLIKVNTHKNKNVTQSVDIFITGTIFLYLTPTKFETKYAIQSKLYIISINHLLNYS